MTPEQTEALEAARALAAAGIPIFLGQPDPSSTTGYSLPSGWQHTTPDPAVVDAWQPGMALCLVTGHGLDLLDVDPHNGGDPAALNGSTPTSYGAALTPSGGVHSFVRSMGVRSRDSVLPGIDVKAGDTDGKGRGFAFIAPTVRVSKTTGVPTAYRWASAPDVTRLVAVLAGEVTDTSGQSLGRLVWEAHSASRTAETEPYDGPTFEEMDPEAQAAVQRWVRGAVEGVVGELNAAAAWAPGQRDARGRGWEKLCADAALRLGQLARAEWNDLDLGLAEQLFIASAPTDDTWSLEDVLTKWNTQHSRLEPAAMPDLRSPSERDAEAWAQLGMTAPAVTGGDGASAAPLEPGQQLSNTGVGERYFNKAGLKAATAAGDVMSLGPLRTGADNVMWSYEHGVWRSDKHAVENRLTRLMAERFRSGNTRTVEAMVRAHVDTITCDPISDVINFRNGLLDWRTGELAPHSPDVPSTVQLGVEYDPDAECPAFEAFLSQVVPPDVVPMVWELIGYLMYSGNPLHKAVMLTGSGRNGKGTFLRVVLALLDRRNVTSVSLHDLVNTRFTTASLFGALANIAGDIDATYLENTATFKQITGGDTISAEHKGRDRFDFTPWAVPVFSANKIPASADTSAGYLARWLVVPFPHSFEGREDRGLDRRLQTWGELQGIAAKGVRALGTLLDRGDFDLTTSGIAAREEFVRRVDQVRTWLADCCDIDDVHPFVARTELYEVYKRWAGRDGHRPVRASEFYDRLEQGGGYPTVYAGTRGFKRIKVLDDGWTTAGFTPLGAAGAAITNLPQEGADDGAGESGEAAGTPLTDQLAAEVDPTPAPDEIADIPVDTANLGADGADTPHPPSRAHHAGRGVEPSAPPAPTPSDEPPAPTPAKLKAAEKRAAAKAAKVAAAAGEIHSLPAVVTRDMQIRTVSADQAHELLATLTDTGQPLTVDVEHTGFPVGHRDYALRTVQLGGPAFAVVLDPHADDQAAVIRRHLAAAGALHAHSATADLVPLAVAGLIDHDEAWTRMHDTVIPAKLADPKSTGSDPSLKQLAPAVLGDQAVSKAADGDRSALFKAGGWLTETKADTPIARSGWAQVEHASTTMLRYDASDVLDTAALAERLPQVEPSLLAREHLAERMTARVAYRGLRLEPDQVERMHAEQTDDLAEAGERIQAFDVKSPGSDPQVAAALEVLGVRLPRTEKGKPSVAKEAIAHLALDEGPVGDLVRARLDYQIAKNRLGLFLEPYRQLVRNGDGRARPTVYTMEAKTGRMSCRRPNLQQVPREGGYRACITADPGHLLISADFSGVELRVAAALSQDPNLMAIVADPERDIHREIARIVWGPTAGKAERYQAKRKVFGRLYGSGIDGLVRSDPPVPQTIARAIVDAMDAMTPGLTAWSRDIANAVEAGRSRFPAYSGRTIFLPEDRGYAAPNYCIQGTARELLIDALERWSTTRWGDATLLPVHDELLVMVPEDDAEEATQTLTECMITQLYGVDIIADPSEPTYAWKDAS